MQGADAKLTAYAYFEIMLPYAGIIRIRSMGMISARIAPDTPAIAISPAKICNFIHYLCKQFHKL